MTMRPGLLYFVAVDAYVRLLTMLITGTAIPTIYCLSSIVWPPLFVLHVVYCHPQHLTLDAVPPYIGCCPMLIVSLSRGSPWLSQRR